MQGPLKQLGRLIKWGKELFWSLWYQSKSLPSAFFCNTTSLLIFTTKFKHFGAGTWIIIRLFPRSGPHLVRLGQVSLGLSVELAHQLLVDLALLGQVLHVEEGHRCNRAQQENHGQ